MKVVFVADFEEGADIYRAGTGEIVRRVPSCTWHDDDRLRIIEDDQGNLAVEREQGDGDGDGDNWKLVRILGPATDFIVVSDSEAKMEREAYERTLQAMEEAAE